MAHTARMYVALMAAGLRGELQYRLNFVLFVFTGIVYQLTGFVFIWVVLSRFPTLGGWTLGEVAFLYGLRLIGHGASLLLFGQLFRIEQYVRMGEFDRFLVRPVSPLVQVVGGRFPLSALGDFVGGLVLFGVASTMVTIAWTPAAVGYLALAVLGAALIEAGLKVAIGALTFRYLSTIALLFVVDDIFNSFGNYPMRIFGGTIQLLLTFVLPIAFVAYFPATVLLARTDELQVHAAFAYGAPLAGVIVFGLAVLLWGRELRHYQSSGH